MQSELASFIRVADLIVWDEAPMMHKHVYEAFDRTLRDILGVVDPANKHKVFGGKVVVMGGDFRQILPVVRRGTRGDIVLASLNQSAVLWRSVVVHQLHQNMRVSRLREEGDAQGAQVLDDFAAYLKRVGEGTETVYPAVGDDAVLIPPIMCASGGAAATADSLLADVYGELPTCTNVSDFNQ